MTFPPETRTGNDLAQVKQALLDRDKAENRFATTEPGQAGAAAGP